MDVFLEYVFSPGSILCFHLCLVNYIRYHSFFFFFCITLFSEDELGHKTRSGTKVSFVSLAVIYSSAICAKPTVIILKSMYS